MKFDILKEIEKLGISQQEIIKHLSEVGLEVSKSDFSKILNGKYNNGVPTVKSVNVIDKATDYILALKGILSTPCEYSTAEDIEMCLNCPKIACSGTRRQFENCQNKRRRING